VNILLDKLRIRRLVRLPNSDGIVPRNLLFELKKNRRFFNSKKERGKVSKALLNNTKEARDVKFPIVFGS